MINTLLLLLFTGSFGLKVAYLDGDVKLQRTVPIDDQVKKDQSRGQTFLNLTDQQIDANPYLFNGIRGLPGLEFRINPYGFSYISLLANPIINDEIRRFQLSPIQQCFPELYGCITIFNLFISKYRCPQQISIYPTPPNRLVLTFRNLDIELTGNVNGEIEIILPMKLNSMMHISAHQISTTIQVTVHRILNGSAYVRIIECDVTIGFVDVVMEDDSIFGNIFNSRFRGIMARKMREQLPIKVCAMIKDTIGKMINLPLRNMSQIIPLNKLSSLAKRTISSIKMADLPKHCRTPYCRKQILNWNTNLHLPTPVTSRNSLDKVQQQSTTTESLKSATLPPAFTKSQMKNDEATLDPCADCYDSNKSNPIHNLIDLDQHIDAVLSYVMLNMQLTKISATPDFFLIGLSGEFILKGENIHIPFYPFPMQFPQKRNGRKRRMMEVLISDYTINSLLYYLHKRDFIMYRIGPETPKLGEILKTTCNDEDYDEFDDFEMDDEDFDGERNSTVASIKFTNRRKRSVAMSNTDNDNSDNDDNKSKEKKSDDIFGELGICIGDIMPAIREKYPQKLIHIKIRSKRAPSVILLAKNDGITRIDLELEAKIYIDDSGEKVGTMIISSIIDGNVQITGNRILIVIEIRSMELIDQEQTLGLPRDALDNLANLSKDVIAQMANNALLGGLTIDIPTGKLPLSIVDPEFLVVNRAIHLAADFKVSSSVLGLSSSSTICR
uniref:Lipid-binding serum glycoprotein C-terminal domain-containing protein n=1 Tax=Setaria digitata TaxID=48799 RepID=A0A915PUV9_9BILA